jgi:hypothetical protein
MKSIESLLFQLNPGDQVEMFQFKTGESMGKWSVDKVFPTKIIIRGYVRNVSFDRKTGMEIKESAVLNPKLRYIVPCKK